MINVVKGQDRTVRVNFEQDGAAWSLSGMTEITIKIPAETTITKLYTTSGVSVISSAGGIVEFTLSDTETATLNLGYGQAIEITVDKSSTRKIFQVRNILNVTASLF